MDDAQELIANLMIVEQRAKTAKAEAEAELAKEIAERQPALFDDIATEQRAKTAKAELDEETARMLNDWTRVQIKKGGNPLISSN